ncbi:MAG: DUF3784 domain-containing protein [Flavobacteriaceae bacterium]
MILTAVIFIVLGIAVKNGKMYNLIAGYNTLSDGEKAKIDIEGVALVFRNTLCFMGIAILIGVVLDEVFGQQDQISFYTMMISCTVGIPYLLFKTNSSKYKK